ncbi:MAG: dephospho-CoA kinase [Candidatus Bipolaricaulis sp.]|nr:dephospho-CoA kinase [Candidatus Bipolaricaulis sp.]
MHVIGLAGPAGSGKSAVARELSRSPGAVWVELDRVAWSAYEPGTPVFSTLVERFGREIVGADGRIDRSTLADRAFATADAKRDLDKLVHPAVSALLTERIAAERRRGCRLLLVEGALLAVSSDVDHSLFDAILWLDAAPATRAERLRAAARPQHAMRTSVLVRPEGTVRIDTDAPLAEVVRRVRRAIDEQTRSSPRR